MTTLVNTRANHRKQYQIWIEKVGDRFAVRFAYGRIGYEPRPGTKTIRRNRAAARRVAADLAAAKMRRGYRDARFGGFCGDFISARKGGR